jgi:dTDP-4-amino-4,6-dideoxygalactose transaminase
MRSWRPSALRPYNYWQSERYMQVHLKNHGVQALLHYPVPVHYQRSCADIRWVPVGRPASEAHPLQCLSLPCHLQMSAADVAGAIDVVHSFVT